MARERTPKLSRKGFRKKTGAGDMGIIAYHKAISGAIKRQPGGPNAPPPSALAQGGQLIQAAPSALVHFGLGAATDPIAGAGTGALIGGSIGSLAGGVGALPGALVGGLVGGAVGTVGAAGKWLFGDDDEPFETTKEVGSSIQRTAGRLVNPSRYLRASERGEIVGTIVEDLANLSIIAGGVKIGIGTVGGKGLAAASQLDRNITAALRAQAQHLAEADRLVAGASRVGVAEEQALALVGRAAEHAATAQTFGAQAAALGGKSAAAAARARPLMKAYRGAEAVERLGARGAFLPAKVWLLPGKVLPPAAKYFGPGLAAQIARAPWGESLVAAVHAGATRVASWKSGLQQRIKVRDETAQWAQKSDEIMEPINRATNEIYEVLPDELHQEAAILDHQRIGFVLTEVTRANPELLEPILNELTNAEGGVFATFTVEGLRMAIDVELRSRWEASGKGIPPEIEGRMPSDVYVRIRKAQEIYKTRVEAPLAVHHAQGTGRFERPFTAEARANAAWDITGEGPLPAAIAAMERRWDNIAGRVADRLDDAQKALDTVAKKEHWTAEEIADARKTIEVDLTEAVRLAGELVQNNPAAVKDILKAANRNPKTKSSVVIALADLIYGAPAKGVVPGDGSHLGAALADGKWSDGALIPSAFGARLGHMTPVVRRAAQEGRVARLMAEAQDLRTRASNERSRGNKAEADLADARAEVVEGSVKKVQEAGENLETAQETYEHALDAAGELGVRQGKEARNAAHGVLRTEIVRYRATIAYQTNKAAGGGGGITPESMAARADVVRNHKLRSDSGINVSELKEHLDRFDTAISSGEFERAEHHLIEAEYISQVIDVDAFNRITAEREAAFVDRNLKARYEPIVGEAPAGEAPAAAFATGGITPESMAARAAELEPLTENGPDYNKGVVDSLEVYRYGIRAGNLGLAEYALLDAEVAAGKITLEARQGMDWARKKAVDDAVEPYNNQAQAAADAATEQYNADKAALMAKRSSGEMPRDAANQEINDLNARRRAQLDAESAAQTDFYERAEQARYEPIVGEAPAAAAAAAPGGITPQSMEARAAVVRGQQTRPDSQRSRTALREHLDGFDTAISSGDFERAEHHLIEAEYISQVIDVDAYNQITADREAALTEGLDDYTSEMNRLGLHYEGEIERLADPNDSVARESVDLANRKRVSKLLTEQSKRATRNAKARYEPIVGEAPAAAAAPAPGGITPESMAARAAKLKPLTESGLDYNRGVVDHLGHYRRHIRQKAYGEAERELLHAEYLADVITWEQFQETLAERQATVKDFMDRYGNDSESLLAEHNARVAEINAKRRSGEMDPGEAGQARTAADTEYNARSNEGRKARRGLQEQAEQARYEPLVEGAEPPSAESAAPPIGDPLFMEGTVEEAILAIEADRGIVHPENALTRAELKTVADAVTNNLRPELPSIGLDRFGNPGFTPKINAVYHSIMNAVRRYSEASPEAPGTPTPAPTAALVKQLVNQFSRLGIRVGRAQGAAAGFGRVADVSERAAARTQQPATVLGEAAAESAARATASGLKKGFAAGERHRDVMRASQDVARLERQAANIPARREAALARERALIRNAPSRYRPALVAVSRARKVMNKAADQADQAVPGSGDVIRQALDDVPDTLERLVAGLGDTSRPAFYRGGKLPKYGAGNVGRSSEGMLPRTARATNEYRRQGVGGPASYREVAELNGQMVAQWMANESAHAIQARFGSSAASVLMTPDEGALFREVGDVLGDTDRFLVAANGDTAQARVAMVEELMDAGYVLIEMHRNVGASPGIAGKRTVTDVAVHHSLVTGRRIDPVKLSDAMAEKGYVPYAPEKLFLTETPTKVKVDTVFLPKPMFDAMRQQIGPVGKTEQMLRKVYDPALGVWKGSVLAYSPRWQVGNTVGNAIMATASTLINPVALFRGMNRGRRVIKAMHEGTVDRLPPELQSLANQVEPRLHQGSDSPAMRGGRVGEYETPRTSPLWRTKSGKRAGLIRRGANKMYALNGLVDDMNRIAVFEQQKKTLTLEQVADHASKDLSLAGRTYDQIHTEVAVRMSLKVAGAFNTLLPFERQVMKRIMPFYPWIRHITQLSYRLPKAHPMRVAWILHLADMFGEAPEFSFLEGAIPMDDEGWFFRLGGNLNPFADSAFGVDPSQLSGWRDLAPAIGGAISPAIQVPVQIATGLDMRTMMQTRRPAGTSQLDMYGREKASPFGVSEALLRIGDTMPQPRIGRALADELFGDGQILRYPTGQPIRSSGEDIPRVASGQSVPAGLMPILDLLGIPYPVKHDLAGLRVRRDERYRRDAAAEARYYGTSNAGGSGSLGGPKLSRKGFRKQSTRT